MAEETVEISKSELDQLRRAVSVFDGLWTDKDHGLELKRMMKKKYPESKIPDLETIEVVTKPYDEKISKQEEKVSKLEERITKWETDQKNSHEESQLKQDIDRAIDKYKLSAEGKDKMIARMKEKNNADAEAAAAWVASHQPKPKPVTASSYSPQAMNLYGSKEKVDEWELLHTDPTKFEDMQIAKVLEEFNSAEAA